MALLGMVGGEVIFCLNFLILLHFTGNEYCGCSSTVEHSPVTREVVGSAPISRVKKKLLPEFFRWTRLKQANCFACLGCLPAEAYFFSRKNAPRWCPEKNFRRKIFMRGQHHPISRAKKKKGRKVFFLCGSRVLTAPERTKRSVVRPQQRTGAGGGRLVNRAVRLREILF